MQKFIKTIYKELLSIRNSIESIAGLIISLIGVTTITAKLFNPSINLSILLIGVFIFIRRVCKKIIIPTTTNNYSRSQRLFAKYFNLANYLLLGLSIYLATDSFIEKNIDCSISPNLSIIVTSFSPAQYDDFTHLILNTLMNSLEGMDTISVLPSTSFVNISQLDYIDSIKAIFRNNCHDHGLLLYGKRSDASKLFDCNIYVNNLFNLNTEINYARNKNVIYIKNPDIINFSIEFQAITVSEFVIGLLFYNSNHFDQSISKFREAISSNSNQFNIKFLAYCYLFIGNSYFKQSNYTEAAKAYLNGINLDTLNSYLYYNMATTQLLLGDSISSFNGYEKAISLNKLFSNPIANYDFGSQVSEASKGSSVNINKQAKKVSEISKLTEEPIYIDTLRRPNSLELFSAIIKDGLYGIEDSSQNIIINPLFDTIINFTYENKLYFIVKNNGKFGAYNEKGKIEIPINHKDPNYVIGLIRYFTNEKMPIKY